MKKIQTKDEAIHSVIMGNKTDYSNIYIFAEQWVKKQFKAFSADELKKAYFEDGGSIPIQPKVFGAVFKGLSKEKLIFPIGYTVSKNIAAHGRPLRTWISREYCIKQKENASNKSNLKLEL